MSVITSLTCDKMVLIQTFKDLAQEIRNGSMKRDELLERLWIIGLDLCNIYRRGDYNQNLWKDNCVITKKKEPEHLYILKDFFLIPNEGSEIPKVKVVFLYINTMTVEKKMNDKEKASNCAIETKDISIAMLSNYVPADEKQHKSVFNLVDLLLHQISKNHIYDVIKKDSVLNASPMVFQKDNLVAVVPHKRMDQIADYRQDPSQNMNVLQASYTILGKVEEIQKDHIKIKAYISNYLPMTEPTIITIKNWAFDRIFMLNKLSPDEGLYSVDTLADLLLPEIQKMLSSYEVQNYFSIQASLIEDIKSLIENYKHTNSSSDDRRYLSISWNEDVKRFSVFVNKHDVHYIEFEKQINSNDKRKLFKDICSYTTHYIDEAKKYLELRDNSNGALGADTIIKFRNSYFPDSYINKISDEEDKDDGDNNNNTATNTDASQNPKGDTPQGTETEFILDSDHDSDNGNSNNRKERQYHHHHHHPPTKKTNEVKVVHVDSDNDSEDSSSSGTDEDDEEIEFVTRNRGPKKKKRQTNLYQKQIREETDSDNDNNNYPIDTVSEESDKEESDFTERERENKIQFIENMYTIRQQTRRESDKINILSQMNSSEIKNIRNIIEQLIEMFDFKGDLIRRARVSVAPVSSASQTTAVIYSDLDVKISNNKQFEMYSNEYDELFERSKTERNTDVKKEITKRIKKLQVALREYKK